ncbi:MAG: hypothetical protein H0U22_17700 [Geodermatophilaceae bacterium]|nr:hypothetical protein [Geodermatophilaceae bacterium]
MTSIDDLSPEEVIAALQLLTTEVRDRLPQEQQDAISSESDAILVLAAMNQKETTPGATGISEIDPEAATVAARELLAAAARDPEVGDQAAQLITAPPDDDQMAVLGGLEIVIVIGALVTLLQTKVHLRLERRDGKVDFSADLRKEAADSALIAKIMKISASLLGGS